MKGLYPDQEKLMNELDEELKREVRKVFVFGLFLGFFIGVGITRILHLVL